MNFLIIFLSGFFFLISLDEPSWKQNLGSPWNSLIPVAVPLLMVLTLEPLTHIVLTSEGERLFSFLCKINLFSLILPGFFSFKHLFLLTQNLFSFIQALSELGLLSKIWEASFHVSYHQTFHSSIC